RESHLIIYEWVNGQKLSGRWKKVPDRAGSASYIQHAAYHLDMLVDGPDPFNFGLIVFNRPFVPALIVTLAFVPEMKTGSIVQVAACIYDALGQSNVLRGYRKF